MKSTVLFMINDKVKKINKANEAKLHAADEKEAKKIAVVKDKVWEKTLCEPVHMIYLRSGV